MKALILAGGKGTRLRNVVGNMPKSLARIFDKPFLEHQMQFLKKQNIKDIILAVHYEADMIKSYFKDGGKFEVNITYSEEKEALGTAGAIKNAERYIKEGFFALNGDSYSDINLNEFLKFHKKHGSDFSIGVTKSKSPLHYGNVIMDGSKIIDFSEKKSSLDEGFVNSGVYIFEPEIFELIERDREVSLEREIFPKLVKEGRLHGYVYDSYFMDIGRPETYMKFRDDMLNTLILKRGSSIIDAMRKIEENAEDVVWVCEGERKLLGVLNNKIIRRHLIKTKGIEDRVEDAMIPVKDIITAKTTDNENFINELLFNKVNRLPILDGSRRIVDVKFRTEEIKKENYPVFGGLSPLRISFFGGGTDVSHFFEEYGGAVISTTINKYCHAKAAKRADSKITLSHPDLLKEDIVLDSYKDIKYDGNLDLVKAVIKVMKPEFGFDISEMRNDIPPGRGLGSSASLAVLVIKLLGALQGTNYDAYAIADLAYKAERDELKIRGGWQDFYAAAIGGFNFMEFSRERRISNPLRLEDNPSIVNELNEHLLLCYVGRGHYSGELHEKQKESFLKNEADVIANLHEIKNFAIGGKDCLVRGDIKRIGELLHKSWENKRRLDINISNPKIDMLYETGLKNGAVGGKLLGAGGGGYILFFYSPRKRRQLEKALESCGGEIMDFNFEYKGAKVWPIPEKDED